MELFNATGADITLDATWIIEARSHKAMAYNSRWKGSGAVIPSQKHFLIVGGSYAGGPASDAVLTSGVTDATSIRLVHGGNNEDAVCYGYDAATLAAVSGAGYTCEGSPVDNLPHDDTIAGMSNSDASISRSGCVDSGDNSADFVSTAPADPQNSTM